MPTLDTESWDDRLRTLYDYWQALHKDDGGLPSREDFDPLNVFRVLPWVWMVDVQRDPLRFKFRLMGTENVTAMGHDPTGMWIDDAYPGFTASESYPDYVKLAEENTPSYRIGPAHYHVPDYKTIERIMLPLVDADNRCDVILAATVYHR